MWYNFDCLIALAEISSMMINGRDKSRRAGLVPNHRWKTFLMNYDISCRCIIDAIYPAKTAIFYSQYTKVLIRNGCCILSNAFTASIEKIIWFWMPFLKIYFEGIALLSLCLIVNLVFSERCVIFIFVPLYLSLFFPSTCVF